MGKRGRPNKAIKYTKIINVRLTQAQWLQVLNWAHKANLEPSVYIRKVLLDFLDLRDQIALKMSEHKVMGTRGE